MPGNTGMSAVIDIREGDCLEVMADMPEASIDAVVTDPPYHLASIVRRFGGTDAAPAQYGTDGAFKRASCGFMGQTWDGGDIAHRPETWEAVKRVLKPGGHLLAFSATKTFHHMAVAIELAGFEHRDSIANLYAEGGAWAQFLDSLSPEQVDALGRALEGADAGLLGWLYGAGFPKSHDVSKGVDKALGGEGTFGAPKSAAHAGWIERGRMRGEAGAAGWQRPWMESAESVGNAARKYLPATPDAAGWQGWGTALKPAWEPIVVARKPLAESSVARQHLATGTGGLNVDAGRVETLEDTARQSGVNISVYGKDSRANVRGGHAAGRWPANVTHDGATETVSRFPVDAGASAARFFYSAKADKDDRGGSTHPTVKPIDLMRWLVRLVTPRGATVLDPFAGSGTTGWACAMEGRKAVLIEQDKDFAAHLRARLKDFDPSAEHFERSEQEADQGVLI